MTDTQDKNTPSLKDKPPAKPLEALEAKRAENLRQNLLKRKLQARARQVDNKTD